MSEKVLVDKKGLETYHKILKEDMLKTSFDLIEDLTDAKGVFEQIESERQINENTRKSNEIKRVSNENKRVEAEKLREQAIEKVKSDNAKLIVDTKKEITDYKNAKDTAINNDLKQFKGVTTQSIEEYKNVKDMEITNNLNSYKTSKDKEIDLYKSNKDTLINNKIAEIEQAKTSLTNDVAFKINEVTNVERVLIAQVDEAVTNMNDNVNSKLEEADNRITELQNYESQMQQIENKNIEQDTRLKQVEHKNKVQDVYINGLFNENNDKRLSIEGEGNSLKLEGSKEGLVEVNKVVGNTLVNIMPDANWGYLATGEHGGNCAYIVELSTLPFKPNTVYTTILLNAEGVIHSHWMHLLSTSSVVDGTIGTFTTISDISTATSYLHIYFSNGVTQEQINKIKVIVLEGDYTNKPIPSEYFEGMQSSFEECKVTQEMVDSGEELAENLGKYKCEVKVRGKNLFDMNGNIDEYVETNQNSDKYPNEIIGGKLKVTRWSSMHYCRGQWVRVKPNTNYIFSYAFEKINNNLGIRLDIYNKNSAIIISKFDISQFTFNTGNTDKILITFLRSGSGTPDGYTLFSNIQLEEGTQATPYEPYFERTQTVYLNSPLLKGDEIVMKDGELCHYHKCEYGIVDGSDDEKWTQGNGDSVGIYKYVICPNYADFMSKANGSISDTLINNYGLTMINPYSNPNSGMMFVLGSSLRVRLAPNKDTLLEDFLTIVRNNPIIIVYTLAEPWYEPIQADKLLLECANDSTLHIESIVPVESVKASYTGNVPSVYGMENSILEIEEHNVDMVATTFDMDYRLLEVEWALEDAGLVGISLASTFNLNRKGEKTMALSRYEQAKIMILGGAYDKETLTKQLTRYLEKGLVTKEEYDELIALMEAKELVTGE